MKSKLQQFSVKLLAATLAVIMAVPADVFAMNLEDNSYAADTSVMGIQPQEDSTDTAENTDSSLLKSSISTEETAGYIIEKSAQLSKITGDINYKIVVKAKNPSTESTGEQTTTFAITENTDDEKLSVDDVKALDADGNETDIKFDQHTPNLLNAKEDIRTTGITSAKPQYGMVYYLSTKLTEEALKNLEEKSPQLALDFTIASPNQNPVQTRYSLELTKPDTTQITIDNDNNVVNQTSELVEKEDNLHLYKGEYKKEEKTLFQTTPAHLVWTDYINAKDDKEFAIDFDLDENQDTENSQIKIDYYEASDKGYVLNQSFSKTVDFANSLNLTIPQGYIAKLSLSTAIKENTNAKAYTFNGVKVANPTYKEEKTEKTEEEQASDDADPLPDDSSKNDEEAKPSNDSIADESEQDFSESPKSDTSAIALNKEAYLENLRNEEKLTQNLEKATNDIEQALEQYNKEETNWDEFKATIQNIAKEQNLDQAQAEEILQSLIAGLNEDKYKVVNIDTKEATSVVKESTTQSEPTDTTEKSVDQLVKEKLNAEGITIEDFQNYMYELEEKYGLTNEDAARIYEDNAEAIQGLVTKAQEEKTTGDVFATYTTPQLTLTDIGIIYGVTGTHISKDVGNNVRYSQAVNPVLNSIEVAYTDPRDGQVYYYLLLRPNLNGKIDSSRLNMQIEGATNPYKSVNLYEVHESQINDLVSYFGSKSIHANINNYRLLRNNAGKDISLSKGYFTYKSRPENSAVLLEVKPDGYEIGNPIKIGYKWTHANTKSEINTLNNPYEITVGSGTGPSLDFMEGSSTDVKISSADRDYYGGSDVFAIHTPNGVKIGEGFCLYNGIRAPKEQITYDRVIEINSVDDLQRLMDNHNQAKNIGININPNALPQKVYEDLLLFFYMKENDMFGYGDNPTKEQDLNMVGLMYRIIDGDLFEKSVKDTSNNNSDELMSRVPGLKERVDALESKMKQFKESPYYDFNDIKNKTKITIYYTSKQDEHTQAIITGKADKEPTANFKIKKVANDEVKTPLKKVGFTLYASDKETAIGKTLLNRKGEYFTNDQGELYYSNLPDGIYYLKETSIPDGYIVKDGDPFTTIIIKSGKTKLLAGSVDEEDFDSIINVSEPNTRVKITDDAGSDNYINTDIYGNIDFTEYDDGTYTVSAPGKTTKVIVEDKKVVSSEQDTTNESDNTENEEPERAWVSDSNYVAHGGYPDYMNVMDYSVVEDPNTKQVTTYLMLKPDSDRQKNGTNKDTYLKFAAGNSKISEIEFFRAGSGEIKETLRAAMKNRNLENYFGTEYIGDTFENYESSPIKMSSYRYGENSYYNPLNTNYVKPNSNNYYISIPKSRFDYDESYIVKVVTDVTDTNKESSLSYQWASENQYEASLRTQTRNIPALSQMTKNTSIGVLDRVINTLLPTAYAADVQSDYKDVKITKEAIDDTTNYISYDIENIKDETDVSFTKYGLKVLYGEEKSDFLQGAEFKLQKLENDNWKDTYKTAKSDEDGQVKFYKLSTGEYQIIETKTASDEYRKPEGAVKSFKVENGKVFVDTSDGYKPYKDNENDYIYNELKGEGKLVIKKLDENGNGLNGVDFTLYQFKPASSNSSDDINKVETKRINGEDGLAEWDNLKYGKYWIKETRSKDGYIIDSEKKLVTITKNFDVPKPTNPKDVSSSISIKQGEAYMYSTEGNPNAVYPNIAEGLVANLGLAVKSGVKINPGDYFDVKLSENLDLDGVGNVLDGSDGKFDIVSQYGTIAKASIEKDNRRTIRYTFTNALKYRNITNMKLIVPMYPNRVKVSKDSRPIFKVTVGQSTFTKSDMNVYYSHYQKDGTKPYLNAYTYKLDPYENKFTVIAYVNTKKVNSDIKQYLFEPNVPVNITSFETYRSEDNSKLPPSYGIDFNNNYINYGLTYLGNRYYRNNNNTRFWVNLENNNNNTYVIKIEGTISGTKPRAFETNSYLTHRYNNGAWTTYTANTWSRFYDPLASGDSTPANPEPDQAYLEFVNNKNRIEFTKSFVDSNDSDYNIEVKNSKEQLPKDADEKTAYFKLTGKNASNEEIEIPNAIVDGKNIAWEKLIPGDYTLKELAPKGFEAPKEIKFTVNEGGTITQPTNTELLDNGCYQIANKKPSESKFKILKVDEEGKPLSGVVFELTGPENSDGNPIEKTSDKDGVIEYNGLKPGTYTLKEKTTLNGYVKTNQEWTVTVSNGVTSIKPVNSDSYTADSSLDDINQLKSKGYLIIDENSKTEDPSVATLKVLNRKATYPSTGGSGTFIGFALIGTAIMLAGIAYYGIYVNDKNRRRSNR